MKKTFHLDLDHSGVRLRHGSGSDLPVIGEVALDDPHFETRLEDLRRDAQSLSDGPLTTQLTIPQSEVLFTSVDIPEDVKDETARRKLIEAEMEGLTPYAMDDLVIDWSPKSKTQVAVALVARETLDQAEDFAVTHGFNPQGFTAEPRKGLFRKRPNFGKTAFASSGVDLAVAAPAEPDVTRIADLLNGDAAVAPEPDTALTPPYPDPVVAQKQPEDAPQDTAQMADPDPVDVEQDPKAAATSTNADPNDAATGKEKGAEKGQIADGSEPAREAVMASGPEGATASTPAPAKSAPAEADAAPVPSFSTTRSASADAAPADDATRLGSIASRIAMLPDGGAGPRPGAKPATPAMKAALATGPVRKSQPPGRKSSPVPSIRKVAPPAGDHGADAGDARRLTNPVNPGGDGAASSRTEADQMTVFGARREAQERRGLSFLPLLIGLIVAFALAIGIWSAFFLLNPDTEALLRPAPDAIAPPPLDPAVETDVQPPTGETTATVPSQPDPLPNLAAPVEPDPTLPAATTEIAVPEPQAEDAPLSEPVTPDPIEDTAAIDQAVIPGPNDPLRRPAGADEASRYAATGIEVTPPQVLDAPATGRLDDLYLPRPDGDLRAQDSVAALGAGPNAAAPVTALLPPPPPGERFELNADGLVVATATGALSPQGILVTAGSPPLRPPPAPDRPEAAPEPPSEADLIIPVNQGTPALRPRSRPAPADGAPQQDAALSAPSAQIDVVARLAGLSPLPRPARLTEPPAAVAEPATDGNADPRLAALKPRGRPDSLQTPQAIAQATREAEQTGAALASAAAGVLQAIVPTPAVAAVPVQTSPYAVARSQLPKTRPRNFSRTVARTSRAQAEPVRVAAASAVVRPSGPTRGSVASRATVANAINLGKVNLMGVYGTSANRRALVRLPSGKFIKVKVGDRVDGGRVRAIGDDQLSYTKGGRSILLKMPRG